MAAPASEGAVWWVSTSSEAPNEAVDAPSLLYRWASAELPADALAWTEGLENWLPAADAVRMARAAICEEVGASEADPAVEVAACGDVPTQCAESAQLPVESACAAPAHAADGDACGADGGTRGPRGPLGPSAFEQVLGELARTERTYLTSLTSLTAAYLPALEPLAPAFAAAVDADARPVIAASEALLGILTRLDQARTRGSFHCPLPAHTARARPPSQRLAPASRHVPSHACSAAFLIWQVLSIAMRQRGAGAATAADGGRAAERSVASDLARALDVDESGRHVLDAYVGYS